MQAVGWASFSLDAGHSMVPSWSTSGLSHIHTLNAIHHAFPERVAHPAIWRHPTSVFAGDPGLNMGFVLCTRAQMLEDCGHFLFNLCAVSGVYFVCSHMCLFCLSLRVG